MSEGCLKLPHIESNSLFPQDNLGPCTGPAEDCTKSVSFWDVRLTLRAGRSASKIPSVRLTDAVAAGRADAPQSLYPTSRARSVATLVRCNVKLMRVPTLQSRGRREGFLNGGSLPTEDAALSKMKKERDGRSRCRLCE